MLKLRTLDELGDLSGKTVLVRTDFDVPVKNGEVESNYRIKKSIKTIDELVKKHARVVVLAHLGRPESEYEDEYSLMPVRFELGKLLDMHIKFTHITNCKNSITFMEDGEVLLLENIRFQKSETSKKTKEREEFIAEIAELADYYVNEAFATYRPAASTFELAKKFDKPLAGRQMVVEIEQLSKLQGEVESPYVAIIGGAKLDTKVEILEHLVTVADTVIIGGAMAYTFLKAQGVSVGKSAVEEDKLDIAKGILDKAKKSNCEILLPIDHIAGAEFAEDTKPIQVETQQIPDDLIGLDIGERTLSNYLEIIKSGQTILWNGPMGVFEWPNFSRGTEAVGEYVALSASDAAFKVAGGGDTISAMEKLKINFKNFDHVSTGGGAMLSFIAGEKFPTLELLTTK